MNTLGAMVLALLSGCHFGSPVDEDGSTSRLFPVSPLSEAPCMEDQDCVITYRKDGSCCSDPEYAPSNLYTKDQFERLLAYQNEICGESSGHYTCPEHPPPGHIETVFHGACVESRCVRRSVPAEAPHSPAIEPAIDPALTPDPAPETEPKVPASKEPIETAASPSG